MAVIMRGSLRGIFLAGIVVLSIGLLVMSDDLPQDEDTMIWETNDDDQTEDDEVEIVEVSSESQLPVDPKKVFVPTKEWQIVQPDQAILRGLHVRMNLQTGVKEAKLLDGDDGTEYQKALDRLEKTGHTGSGRAVIPVEAVESQEEDGKEEDPTKAALRENIIEALKNIKSDDGKSPEELSKEAEGIRGKFRSYSELKKDFDEMNLKVETDGEILTRLFEDYTGADSVDVQVNLLDEFEYLVHQYDNAIMFIDMGGLQRIVKPGINSTNSMIKQGVLHVLGSAVQSNPKVQIATVEAGLLQSLIRVVAYDTQEDVARKAIYALSCTVRGFPYGQQMLIQHGGLQVLRKVFDRQDWKSLPLQLKVVSLLHDLLVERAEAKGERLQQLTRLNLDEQLAIGGWCPAVSSLLAAASFDRRDRRYDMGAALKNEMPLRPDHDTVDKVVSAMGSMVDVCRYHFHESLPLLRHFAYTYDDLAYKEQFQDNDDEGHALFKDLAEAIHSLVKNINQKHEL